MRPFASPPLNSIRSVLFALAVATSALAAGGSGGAHLWRGSAGWGPVAWSDQGLPPPITPALFQKFLFLLFGYEALGGDSVCTFAEWLVMNRITDPLEFSVLMWLWRSHCAANHAA